MDNEQFDLETATAISSLIGEQADLLWTAAMALIVAQVFIGCRYFIDRENKFRWKYTGILWVGSIVCYLVSLGCGYFVKGSLITMTRAASKSAETYVLFRDAELMAFLQASALFLGLVLLAIAFGSDFKRMAKAISEGT